MPGILPMKVIKLGTSAQSRIAQACDRCRSKKIRCDGITPCCTQCANVGFECKTSDKLSRRAFPRGYTESLEERVRSLEQEVRELKDLLDEKDEKIDMLSRIHSASPVSRRSSNDRAEHISRTDVKPTFQPETSREDVFRVHASHSQLATEADSYCVGPSSARAFIDTFKAKAQQSGKQCPDVRTGDFVAPGHASHVASPQESQEKAQFTDAPARLVSDQMVNIFFQEWAPLFPVLHRPTFLKLYTEYISNPDDMHDKHSLAQLNLVFGIGALSAEWNKQNAESFERQWSAAIEAIPVDNDLATLQCLLLAQMYCIAKGDYNKLLYYKGIGVSLAHGLGLYQSPALFQFDALIGEMRKRVFWTLYTVDCFSAAMLGLPTLLQEDDIQTEYPVDVDDENISEHGFEPTMPGESTRLSSALAMFRCSRILAEVLNQVYPARMPSYELSLQKLAMLQHKLDTWLNGLPRHLHLQFVQDKPSTRVIGSRSPLLSLAYHYIRSLIHRPAVSSSLGSRASLSIVALASSSKHIVQIVQLLEERRMSFSFCLNKNELLLLSGFGLLFQGLDLDRRGKLMQDSERLVCSVIAILERNAAVGSKPFKAIACAMMSVGRQPVLLQDVGSAPVLRQAHNGSMGAPGMKPKQVRKQAQALASRRSTGNISTIKREAGNERRSTAPAGHARSASVRQPNKMVSMPAACHDLQLNDYQRAVKGNLAQAGTSFDALNLDYLSFRTDSAPTPSYPSTSSMQSTKSMSQDDFADVIDSAPLQAPFDSLFPSTNIFVPYITPSPSTTQFDSGSGSDSWTNLNKQAAGQSVPNLTDEEHTSGEELSGGDVGHEQRGMAMSNGLRFGLENFEVDFGT